MSSPATSPSAGWRGWFVPSDIDGFFGLFVDLSQGFLLISIFFSAILAKIIDRAWLAAACWCFIAAACSACGLIHNFVWNGPGREAGTL